MGRQVSGRGVQALRVPELIIGLVLGIGGTVLVMTIFGPTNIGAGDWLSFSGGLLGVGLAVLGAIFVEGLNRQQDAVDDIALLLGALTSLQAALDSVEDEIEISDDNLDASHRQGQELIDRLAEATAVLEYARDNSKLTSAEQVLAVFRLEDEMENLTRIIDKEDRWLSNATPSVKIVAIFFGNIMEAVVELRPTVAAALDALRRT